MAERQPSTPEPPKRPSGGKVLVALQGSTPAPDVLSAATALARSLQAELAALFVEDTDLLRLSALPFTREVGLASGAVRPFETADLERVLRWQAERLRQALGRVAQDMALPWSFQVARSTLLEQLMTGMTTANLVVFGRQQRTTARAASALPRTSAEGVVSALVDPSEAGLRALSAALELAQGRPERLSLLVLASRGSDLQLLRRRAAELLRLPADGPPLKPVGAEAGDLSRETRRRRSCALVVSTHSLPEARTQLRVLLEVTECPVVLVS